MPPAAVFVISVEALNKETGTLPYRSTFHIADMDCPSEENLIRLRLDGVPGVLRLSFDLDERTLEVLHEGPSEEIAGPLETLGLGSRLVESAQASEAELATGVEASAAAQRRLLWTVLAINAGFFVVEMTAGLLSRSMGLVADSLDMLADAIVYALALWAVGGAVARKKRVATLSGYFQMALAFLGMMEVIRRFVGADAVPDFRTMIVVSLLALVGNSICLYLLQKTRDDEAHIKASMIFTSNDVIINSGVIVAGILVLLTGSKYPDLVIGAIVFVVVIRGAIRILKLGRS
jgi:copper chaperone CopZ